MKPSLIIAVIILVATFYISCDNSEEKCVDDVVGTWIWIQSSGGIAGETQTPESTGESRKVVFKNGAITFYTDDEITRSASYALEKTETIFSDDIVPVVILDDNGLTDMYAYTFTDCNELELSENVYDGYSHRYKRD